jgi:hypothetical protein
MRIDTFRALGRFSGTDILSLREVILGPRAAAQLFCFESTRPIRELFVRAFDAVEKAKVVEESEPYQEVCEQTRLEGQRLRELAEAIDHVLVGYVGLARVTGRGNGPLRLLEILFPAGLPERRTNYREDVGWAEQMDVQLADDKLRAQLSGLMTPYGSMFEIVRDMVLQARKVHDLERQRGAMQRQRLPGNNPSLSDARQMFLRAIEALTVNLEVSGRDEEQIQKLLAPIFAVDREVARRDGLPHPPASEVEEEESLEQAHLVEEAFEMMRH